MLRSHVIVPCVIDEELLATEFPHWGSGLVLLLAIIFPLRECWMVAMTTFFAPVTLTVDPMIFVIRTWPVLPGDTPDVQI